MKNTVILYLRMIFQMFVYLYTSRVVVSALGLVDYGIYDVVASFVIALSFLNNSMTTCTQRFITYALGKGDDKHLSMVFSHSVFIHFVLAFAIFVIGEIVGTWYINNYMVLPEGRLSDVMFLFHISLASSFITIVSVPYNASIIAHERMGTFALITIVDVLLKLLATCSLFLFDSHRIRVYAVLLLVVALIVRVLYGIYCRLSFKTMRLVWKFDNSILKDMLGFMGWNTIGNIAIVCNTQGLNLLLNLVGGPVVNAARGMAFQIQTATASFIASFQNAVNPQITKSWAQGKVQDMNALILRSSRISYMLILLFVIPLMLETRALIELWMPEVPSYAVDFTRLLLCVSVVDTVANPLMVGAAATGDIKKYQIVIGGCMLCTIPLAFYIVKLGAPPQGVFMVLIFTTIMAQIVRMWLCRALFCFSIREFMAKVLKPVVVVTFVCLLPLVMIYKYKESTEGLWTVLLNCVAIDVWVIAIVFLFGITTNERKFALRKLKIMK